VQAVPSRGDINGSVSKAQACTCRRQAGVMQAGRPIPGSGRSQWCPDGCRQACRHCLQAAYVERRYEMPGGEAGRNQKGTGKQNGTSRQARRERRPRRRRAPALQAAVSARPARFGRQAAGRRRRNRRQNKPYGKERQERAQYAPIINHRVVHHAPR